MNENSKLNILFNIIWNLPAVIFNVIWYISTLTYQWSLFQIAKFRLRFTFFKVKRYLDKQKNKS